MPDHGHAVIRAVYTLRDRKTPPRGPTASAIAKHLKLDEKTILAELRRLKDQRIFRDRRSRGERIWEPWA